MGRKTTPYPYPTPGVGAVVVTNKCLLLSLISG